MNRLLLALPLFLLGSSVGAQSQLLRVPVSGDGSVQVYTADGGSNSFLLLRTGEQESRSSLPGPREGEPWLGLTLQAKRDGAPRLEVVEAHEGAPARAAGVEPGDKLVSLAGRQVATHEQLLEVLSTVERGRSVPLTVERSRSVELGRSDSNSKTGFLGVTTSDGTQAAGAAGTGVLTVEPSSSAERLGLRPGDRIAAVDGREVRTFEELRSAVTSHRPGERVELRIQRDLDVVPAPRPAEGATAPSTLPPSSSRGEGAMGGGQQEDTDVPPPGKSSRFFWSTPEGPAQQAPGAEQDRRAPGKAAAQGTPPGAKAPKLPKAPKTPKPPKAAQAPELPGAPQLWRAPAGPGRLAGPQGQAGPGRTGRDPGAGPAAELLEEIRALREEVAQLRREIEALRQRRGR